MAFDLFGLKKGPSTEEPAPAAKPRGGLSLSPKAWVLLAALDGTLVLACAGVVAWRYQAVQAPVPAPAPAKPAPKAKPEPPKEAPKEAPKEEPKPEAKKPEPEPKKPEPAKPEPKKDVPLGRPSVLATPPAARTAAPKGAKPSTRPVPFSHPDPDAKEVYLAGPFLVRSGGRKMMFKDSKGTWTTTVYLNSGQTYKYRFEVVDSKGGKRLTAAQQVEVLPVD